VEKSRNEARRRLTAWLFLPPGFRAPRRLSGRQPGGSERADGLPAGRRYVISLRERCERSQTKARRLVTMFAISSIVSLLERDVHVTWQMRDFNLPIRERYVDYCAPLSRITDAETAAVAQVTSSWPSQLSDQGRERDCESVLRDCIDANRRTSCR